MVKNEPRDLKLLLLTEGILKKTTGKGNEELVAVAGCPYDLYHPGQKEAQAVASEQFRRFAAKRSDLNKTPWTSLD